MGWAERKILYGQIEAKRQSRVICYVTSDRQQADAQIQKDVLPIFYEHLSQMVKAERIDLILHTAGGDTLAGFGICQLLREFSPHIGVLIPLRCHSAGSLIALGANEIVMVKGATLSPIDPSIVGPLNPAVEVTPGQRQMVPLSVETVAGFKSLVTEDWGIKGEESLTAALKMLVDKVHPLALGDVYRARQQIEDLANKLLKQHRGSDELTAIIQKFTRGLGSHDYPISKSDAKSMLGTQIVDSPDVEKLVWDVYEDFAAEMQLREPFAPEVLIGEAQNSGKTGMVKAEQLLSIIETTHRASAAERAVMLPIVDVPPGKPVPGAKVVKAGWRHYS